MSEAKAEIVSESTYTDERGFEIREGLDEHQNRVLLEIRGEGSFFSVPDGIYALAKDAFSEVTESMCCVFIPKSVKVVPAYTFGDFRGEFKFTIDGKEPRELTILCEADRRPEGFYVEVCADTIQEDYEFYTECHYRTWCGYSIRTGKSEDGLGSGDIVSYGLDLPHVHWGVSAQESLKYCETGVPR